MDRTLPRTCTIDGNTIVTADGVAVEVVGGVAAAPEVAERIPGCDGLRVVPLPGLHADAAVRASAPARHGCSERSDQRGRTPGVPINAELADRLRSDLAKLDRPELCVPTPPKINPADLLPSIDDLNKAIDGHNQQSDRQLPNVRNVAHWDGSTQSGTFVDVGNGLVAQHQGRGDYAVADVQQ